MTNLIAINDTHRFDLQSWVDSANEPETDFPIQNLPYGRFRVRGDIAWRIGVAIGNKVLDLRATGLIDFDDINRLIGMNPECLCNLRASISNGLRVDSEQKSTWSAYLFSQSEVELGLPCDTRDYTDFYIGIHHATAVGKLFRPDNPLLPNYKYVPIGYHGRASSIVASGSSIRRPVGQIKLPEHEYSILAPSKRLDLELELGVVIGQSNDLGESVPISQAENHIFGLTLFNDWSARDIQAWEYQPLGPFLSKSFGSTISPWMVTLEALAPFRKAIIRPKGDPLPMDYLIDPKNQNFGAFDINLEVLLQTDGMRKLGISHECISRSNFSDAAYWTVAQLVTHHTINGCNLSAGDLFGTGTLSGPRQDQAGSMLELSQGGRHAFKLSNGDSRVFLEDGDSVLLKAICHREDFRKIGFGECVGTILPAH